MKSKKSEDKAFSMADFEKGLVLAGLLTPKTSQELEEIEAFEVFENQKKSKTVKKDAGLPTDETKKLYFKRVVLAAEIVSELHEEPTFGRIKFQKLVYLCEHAAALNVQHRYKKLAAGPFDHRFMHTIVAEFKKQNWFTVENIKQEKFTRSKYLPLPGCANYKKYYNSYFLDSNVNIKKIIELFREKKTDFTEISATLCACYLELKETQKENIVNEDKLLSLFYSWSERKIQFDKSIVLENWLWLQKNGLVNIEEE